MLKIYVISIPFKNIFYCFALSIQLSIPSYELSALFKIIYLKILEVYGF